MHDNFLAHPPGTKTEISQFDNNKNWMGIIIISCCVGVNFQWRNNKTKIVICSPQFHGRGSIVRGDDNRARVGPKTRGLTNTMPSCIPFVWQSLSRFWQLLAKQNLTFFFQTTSFCTCFLYWFLKSYRLT